jgi:hypothetical protein
MRTDIAENPRGREDVADLDGPDVHSQAAHERAYLLVLMKILRLHADADQVTAWLTATEGPSTEELTQAGAVYIAVGHRLVSYAQQYLAPLVEDSIGADGGS